VKSGELVEIIQFSRWGGIRRTGRWAIVLSTAYQGYDKESTRWNVLIDGEVLVMMEKMLGKPESGGRLSERW